VPEEKPIDTEALTAKDEVAPVIDKSTKKASIRKTQKDAVKPLPAVTTKGSLTVNSMPWANIFINDKSYGTTPKIIKNLNPGKYTVRLENPNFPTWEKTVIISEGIKEKVSHKFGELGALIVNAHPWGNVYVDGVLKGQTPLTIKNILPGKHELKIVKEGYQEFSRIVEVKNGSSKQVSASLKKETK